LLDLTELDLKINVVVAAVEQLPRVFLIVIQQISPE